MSNTILGKISWKAGRASPHKARIAEIGRFTLVIVLLVIIVATAIGNPRFLSFKNILNIFFQVATLGIVSFGQTFLLVAAGLDLSVGAMLSVAGLVSAIVIVATGSLVLGILAGVLAGAVIGFANGVLIATNRATPFIVTLGTMTFLQGVAIIISGGSPINGVDSLFNIFGVGGFLSIPYPIYVMLVTLIVGYLVLKRTVLGRYAFAIGGNEEAARLSGVPVWQVKILLYTVNGIFVGIAAVVLTGILDSALPSMGTGYELQAIAAVVIGGTSLFGGRGTIIGTLGGVLLLGLVSNSMNLLGVGANFQSAVLGLIITAAVLLQRGS